MLQWMKILILILTVMIFNADFSQARTMPVSSLDPSLRAAVNRLNEYRRAADLRELEIDSDMTSMAQAHADYFAQNCEKGADFLGHYERPEAPGYTPGGDEAARTSGLGFNAKSPLDALEMLMSLPYHRTQFLEAGAEKVGVGFSSSNPKCKIGLFMTRRWKVDHWDPKLPSPDHAPGGSAMVAFPPQGVKEVPTLFNPTGEMPDPRPTTHAKFTGYPITIRFTDPKMAQAVRSVSDVKVVDDVGIAVPVWISHPNQPAIDPKAAPTSIYDGTDKKAGTDWIGRNHDSVFLLPQTPLMLGSKYHVEARIQFTDSRMPDQILKWDFETTAFPIR